jgi:hypothetical protein
MGRDPTYNFTGPHSKTIRAGAASEAGNDLVLHVAAFPSLANHC